MNETESALATVPAIEPENKPEPVKPELDLSKLNASPNVPGRNDKCRCGSGKKYKKCCLDNDTAKQLEARRFIGLHPELAARLNVGIDRSTLPLYPWMSPLFQGVGKFAPKDAKPINAKQAVIPEPEAPAPVA